MTMEDFGISSGLAAMSISGRSSQGAAADRSMKRASKGTPMASPTREQSQTQTDLAMAIMQPARKRLSSVDAERIVNILDETIRHIRLYHIISHANIRSRSLPPLPLSEQPHS